jgi:hypothetical protein
MLHQLFPQLRGATENVSAHTHRPGSAAATREFAMAAHFPLVPIPRSCLPELSQGAMDRCGPQRTLALQRLLVETSTKLPVPCLPSYILVGGPETWRGAKA